MRTGDQFTLAPNATFDDTSCDEIARKARLSFQAHSAPLDAKFGEGEKVMYVSFHGSWNRVPPTGFKVVGVPFMKTLQGKYEPVAAADSMEGYFDIW